MIKLVDDEATKTIITWDDIKASRDPTRKARGRTSEKHLKQKYHRTTNVSHGKISFKSSAGIFLRVIYSF